MDNKPSKLKKTHGQHAYEWMLRRGILETFDLSWPCLTSTPPVATDEELAAHREVLKIFKSIGVN